MKKFLLNIYNFLASKTFLFFLVRSLKVIAFLIAIIFVGPWLWPRLDPAIIVNASYLEFVCASILCWWFIRGINRPRTAVSYEVILDEEDDDNSWSPGSRNSK